MPGAVVDLLGLGLVSCAGLTISVLLGVASGDSFHDDDGLVGVLMLGFACILGVASLGVGAGGFVERYRSDPPPPPRVTAVGTSAEATLLQSFSEVLAQQAFQQLALKMVFWCGSLNLIAEVFMLKHCVMIPLMPPSALFSDPDEEVGRDSASGLEEYLTCPNYGIMKDLPVQAQQTMLYTSSGTAWCIGFFTQIFGFADIRRGILGLPLNFPCTGRTVRPWIKPMKEDLLELWFIWPWATGRRWPVVRRRIWVRAFLVGTQLWAMFTIGTTVLLLLVHQVTSWDGGMRPSSYVAFKVSWCVVEAMVSATVAFAAATSEKTVLHIQDLHRRAAATQRGVATVTQGEEDLGTPLRGVLSV